MSSINESFSYPHALIRDIADDDIPELVTIINSAYAYQDAVKGEPRTNPEHLRNRIATSQFYVIEVSGAIAGCVYIEPKGDSLHFGLLTVIPEFRGTGLAKAIITAIEQYAEGTYTTVELDYMSLAPWLKKYYESYGYRETGKVEPWGKIDLIRMSKKLHK